MRSIAKRTLISISMASFLTACGGGDDAPSVSLPEAPASNVAGVFKDAFQTGVFYNKEEAPQDFGYNGRHCAENANSRYYETANALIYGASYLPNSDFEQAAKWVEGGFIAATDLMGMSKNEYFDNRRGYSQQRLKFVFRNIAYNIEKERMLQHRHYVSYEQLTNSDETLTQDNRAYIANTLMGMVYESNGTLHSYPGGFVDYLPEGFLSFSDESKLDAILTAIGQIYEAEAKVPVTSPWLVNVELPHDFDLWEERQVYTPNESRANYPLENYIYKEFKSLSNEEQYTFLAHALAIESEKGYGSLTVDELYYEKKLYVCLSEKASDIGWGEGTNLGITFTAPSVYQRNNPEQVILHELIHTLQSTYTSSPEVWGFIPRWMTEGQAVYLSGQNVAKASDHHHYDPLSVIWFSDEYGDPGEAYEHYGLAYSYIHENNSIMDVNRFYQQFDGVYDDISWYSDNNISRTFETQFGLFFTDHNNVPLELSRFERDYSQLMSSWK